MIAPAMSQALTPALIVEAYTQGFFPMAPRADSAVVHWIKPEKRGQLSIPNLHIPRRLHKTILQNKKQNGPYRITINTAFSDVITACGQATQDRPDTWINPAIRDVFIALFSQGFAQSVECWCEDRLVGGLYGLALGGAFFGESMFSRQTDASKIALVHLVARLWKGGFTLLDTQFVNPHLKQFGIEEIPHLLYEARLRESLSHAADFRLEHLSEQEIMQAYLAFRGVQG